MTINVVTKRGTNEFHGAARYLYASSNWQSDNTPQEAVDQGLPTNNTRMIREYGADFGGPIVKDKLWLWFAGAYQTINTNQTAFSTTFGTFASPTWVNLEPWSAKLNAQISSANSAQLYFQRSDRTQLNTSAGPTRAPEAQTLLTIPTNFYKVEDSHVFSADLFASIFAAYQSPDYTDLGNGSKNCAPTDFTVACAQEGTTRDAWWNQGTYYNNYRYYNAKDPQRQANVTMSKFFNTGSVNHEVKFSFNYRQQIADSATGWPGDQNVGSEYEYSSSNTALLSRGVRPVYKNQFWSGTLGDTITMGNLTAQLGVRYDRQQAKNLPGSGFENVMFPDLLPALQYHGADSWQFDFTNWQPRVSATYALGEKKTTLLRASYAQFADQLGFIGYYASGVPISNGYYYYWNDINKDHFVQPNEVLFDQGVYAFYNDIDPATLPNVPNAIQPNLKVPKTSEFTFGVDQQFTDTLAVSATFSYRNTNNLIQSLPTGVTSLNDWALAGRTQCEDDNGNLGPCVAVAPNGFTLPIDEPYYSLQLPEEPSGVTISDRPGRYAEVLRRRRLGRQTIVGPLDVPRQLRLEQLQAAPDDGIDPGSEQPVEPRQPELRLRPANVVSGGRMVLSRFGLPERKLAVQRERALPGALGHQSRRQLLRPPGLSESVLRPGSRRRGRDRHHPHLSHSDRPARHVPLRQRLRARSPAGQDVPDRRLQHHPGRRGLQRGQREYDPSALPADRRLPGLERDVHPEQLLQPDHRGAESAHPEARHQRQLLGPRHSGPVREFRAGPSVLGRA